jgi:hypothetical protein
MTRIYKPITNFPVTWVTFLLRKLYVLGSRTADSSCCQKSSILFFSNIFLIGIVGGGVQFGLLGTAAAGDYDNAETGGMMNGGGNPSTRRKPAPVSLCPPQNPHAARTRTRAAVVGSQRLTA